MSRLASTRNHNISAYRLQDARKSIPNIRGTLEYLGKYLLVEKLGYLAMRLSFPRSPASLPTTASLFPSVQIGIKTATSNRPSLMRTSYSSFSTHNLSTTCSSAKISRSQILQPQTRRFASNMSFSNTDTGSKPADPYTEKNKQDPSLQEKVDDFSNFVTACKFGMMSTKDSESGLIVSRCMALAAKEAGGLDLIFHTNTESGKTDDLEKDGNINIAFLNSTGEWASLSGKATIDTDRATVKKYYSPALKAWLGDLGDGTHDGSENDPRIGCIRVQAKTVQYAIARSNMVSRGIEMVQGVVTGKAPEVNKLRHISEQEASQWRSQHS